MQSGDRHTPGDIEEYKPEAEHSSDRHWHLFRPLLERPKRYYEHRPEYDHQEEIIGYIPRAIPEMT